MSQLGQTRLANPDTRQNLLHEAVVHLQVVSPQRSPIEEKHVDRAWVVLALDKVSPVHKTVLVDSLLALGLRKRQAPLPVPTLRSTLHVGVGHAGHAAGPWCRRWLHTCSAQECPVLVPDIVVELRSLFAHQARLVPHSTENIHVDCFLVRLDALVQLRSLLVSLDLDQALADNAYNVTNAVLAAIHRELHGVLPDLLEQVEVLGHVLRDLEVRINGERVVALLSVCARSCG
mmetsp:Transcript_1150/g.2504  ORF Transcript_1150/g.2504 Transcript_1150/m.2504 type:complete len:232 (+) Transcript_1150:833-1528(+)